MFTRTHMHTFNISCLCSDSMGLLIDNKPTEVAGVIQMCMTHRTDRHSLSLHSSSITFENVEAFSQESSRIFKQTPTCCPLTSRRNNLNIKEKSFGPMG